MKFDNISIIDLIVVCGLVISLFITLYVGDSNTANVICSGLLGYLGATKHISKQDDTVDKHDKDVV